MPFLTFDKGIIMIVVDFTEEDVEALNYKRYHFERLWKFVKKKCLYFAYVAL